MRVLVVGATGQLGTAVVRRLANDKTPVRAFVRRTSSYSHLSNDGVELAFGDLRDPASLRSACQNVDIVIATANTAIPREKTDTFRAVDGEGYRNLIDICKESGVRQFIYTSALSNPIFDRLPIGLQKRATEGYLVKSGVAYTIFRADSFMDVAFAMMGSDIPVQGSEVATVARPFWFTTKFFNSVKDNISTKGIVGIVGAGDKRHSYISIDDLAEFHVKAVKDPAALNKIFDIGGPEALTQKEVKAIFEKVLNKTLKERHTPAALFKIASPLMKIFSPAAANIIGINYCSAVTESHVDMTETAKLFGVRLTSAEEFLTKRLQRGDAAR
jgi:NADH dehydrogenase